jgi:hypothetical protein
MRLKDKAAIITGAGSGIGRVAALLFAGEGARVAVADRNFAGAQETVNQIAAAGGEGLAAEVDVTEADQVHAMVERVLGHFGQIDILYNHAGINRPARLTDLEEADWDAVIATNLKSIYLGCKYVLPHMVERRSGAIVNTGGTFSFYGAPGIPAYCAAKGGVLNLTKQSPPTRPPSPPARRFSSMVDSSAGATACERRAGEGNTGRHSAPPGGLACAPRAEAPNISFNVGDLMRPTNDAEPLGRGDRTGCLR